VNMQHPDLVHDFFLSNKDLVCLIYLWLYEQFSNLEMQHPEMYTGIFSLHHHLSHGYCTWILILPMCSSHMAF
jgi:hypothetical protein